MIHYSVNFSSNNITPLKIYQTKLLVAADLLKMHQNKLDLAQTKDYTCGGTAAAVCKNKLNLRIYVVSCYKCV